MLQRKTKIELERKKSPDTPFRTMHFCTATPTHPTHPHNQSPKKVLPCLSCAHNIPQSGGGGKKRTFCQDNREDERGTRETKSYQRFIAEETNGGREGSREGKVQELIYSQ